tara:strand:+ start:69 stop:416 length:348 start_codon:yes stop_codon:yes gene_type:complete
MSFDWNVKTNHNNTATYQLSGLPYTTQAAGGAATVNFPRVTKWIVLRANGAVTIKFTNKGGNSVTGFTMAAGDMTPRLDIRCAKIFKTGAGTLEVIAGLTTAETSTFIDSDEFDW